ncbi:hypothetical protein BWI93_17290 [Siphonobacter sp. BAB-5385]|nr:hypothetical protein BWI93_17290 [Siphonobacter sp. BAB-5385]
MKKYWCIGWILGMSLSSQAQTFKEGKLWLNEDGSNYFKVTLNAQIWLRNTELNPGSTVNGFAQTNVTDIGIRRARLQAFGQIADRVFIYTQIGMNNFSALSDRKAGFFIHDINGDYEVVRKKLFVGGGLTAWNGLSRFSAPAVGSILGIDAPLFEQNTNDVTDQFLRKLSLYAKGKWGKLDYRLVMSNPMSITKAAGYTPGVSGNSSFSPRPTRMQWHGYVQWQFLDPESNVTGYNAGTYLGSKRVLNVGAGFQYQPAAQWHLVGTDTVSTAMRNFAVDLFYDVPLNSAKGTALSAYAVYMHTDYGPGYLRNQATMNPASGTTRTDIVNGSGNGYPSFGTGHLLYGQVGYKCRENLLGKTTLMPYASLQYARYERLNAAVLFWDAGINWLLKGQTSKLTLAYQNRPVFQNIPGTNTADRIGTKGAVLLQYQVFWN